MKVILNRDIVNLGEEGDIVDVSDGYARNYLLPKGFVLQHNAQNVSFLEGRRARIEQRREEKHRDAISLKERLETETLVVKMLAGENGKLFGSVTSATIVDELAKIGIDVERKRIEIPESSLKTLGNFQVRVRLYGDNDATLNVAVENSQPTEQKQSGQDGDAPAKRPRRESSYVEETTEEDDFEAAFAASAEAVPEEVAVDAAADGEPETATVDEPEAEEETEPDED